MSPLDHREARLVVRLSPVCSSEIRQRWIPADNQVCVCGGADPTCSFTSEPNRVFDLFHTFSFERDKLIH